MPMKMEEGRNYTWDQKENEESPPEEGEDRFCKALSFMGAPCPRFLDKNLTALQNAALPTRVEIMAQHLK